MLEILIDTRDCPSSQGRKSGTHGRTQPSQGAVQRCVAFQSSTKHNGTICFAILEGSHQRTFCTETESTTDSRADIEKVQKLEQQLQVTWSIQQTTCPLSLTPGGKTKKEQGRERFQKTRRHNERSCISSRGSKWPHSTGIHNLIPWLLVLPLQLSKWR